MAEILKLENSSREYVLEHAVRLILRGKVVAFPTDTLYALAADPFRPAALERVIFAVFGRDAYDAFSSELSSPAPDGS